MVRRIGVIAALAWCASACQTEHTGNRVGESPAIAFPDSSDTTEPPTPEASESAAPPSVEPPPSGTIDAGADGEPDPPATAVVDAGSGAQPPDAAVEVDAPEDDDRCSVAVAQPTEPPVALELSGDLGTHDPTLIERDGVVYLLQTGADFGTRLPGKTTTDLRDMRGGFGALGSSNPGWVAAQVPEARNLWAPDLSFFGGAYHLYYSASSFGSNHSCIGHATSDAIGDTPFEDHGSVICSSSGDNHNAIDPNVVLDEDGTPWLFFGSFWDGIRAAKLDVDGARADGEVHRIASRGGGSIEAPVVVRRCGYYYLFVSFGSCCRGADSTYEIRVGRSTDVLGPYVDRDGTAMLEGGGTLLVEGDARFAAAGHNAVLFRGDAAFNVYHAYRRSDGQPELRIAELVWDTDGWPLSGGP